MVWSGLSSSSSFAQHIIAQTNAQRTSPFPTVQMVIVVFTGLWGGGTRWKVFTHPELLLAPPRVIDTEGDCRPVPCGHKPRRAAARRRRRPRGQPDHVPGRAAAAGAGPGQPPPRPPAADGHRHPHRRAARHRGPGPRQRQAARRRPPPGHRPPPTPVPGQPRHPADLGVGVWPGAPSQKRKFLNFWDELPGNRINM